MIRALLSSFFSFLSQIAPPFMHSKAPDFDGKDFAVKLQYIVVLITVTFITVVVLQKLIVFPPHQHTTFYARLFPSIFLPPLPIPAVLLQSVPPASATPASSEKPAPPFSLPQDLSAPPGFAKLADRITAPADEDGKAKSRRGGEPKLAGTGPNRGGNAK